MAGQTPPNRWNVREASGRVASGRERVQREETFQFGAFKDTARGLRSVVTVQVCD